VHEAEVFFDVRLTSAAASAASTAGRPCTSSAARRILGVVNEDEGHDHQRE
jgi:hypothetical protein